MEAALHDAIAMREQDSIAARDAFLLMKTEKEDILIQKISLEKEISLYQETTSKLSQEIVGLIVDQFNAKVNI